MGLKQNPLVKGLAFSHKARKQRRWLPKLGVIQRIERKTLHALDHVE
jgi:hypothetical protein